MEGAQPGHMSTHHPSGIRFAGRRREPATRAILLAGGTGSRLYPMTAHLNKQLLPVYDKPLVYYPLTTLLYGGVSEILVVTRPDERDVYERLLGDGSRFGVRLTYAVQTAPRGIADAFLVGADFVGDEPVALILGDNLFWGDFGFLRDALASVSGATIFAQEVPDPSRFGVVTFSASGAVRSIAEKPRMPRSSWAIPGLYVYDARVVSFARDLEPSDRGELEISALHQAYLEAGELSARKLPRQMAWIDTGTAASLYEASAYVARIERSLGVKVGCPEEAALRMGRISPEALERHLRAMPACPYRAYLERAIPRISAEVARAG